MCLQNLKGASQVVLAVKNPPTNAGDIREVGSIPGSGRCPGEGNGNPLQHSCLGKSHGQRSLVGYNPWDHKELDTTDTHDSVNRRQDFLGLSLGF